MLINCIRWGMKPLRREVGPVLTLQHCAAWHYTRQLLLSHLPAASSSMTSLRVGHWRPRIRASDLYMSLRMLVTWFWPSVGGVCLDDEFIDVIDWHTHPQTKQAPLSSHPPLPPPPLSPQIVLKPGLGGHSTWDHLLSHHTTNVTLCNQEIFLTLRCVIYVFPSFLNVFTYNCWKPLPWLITLTKVKIDEKSWIHLKPSLDKLWHKDKVIFVEKQSNVSSPW